SSSFSCRLSSPLSLFLPTPSLSLFACRELAAPARERKPNAVVYASVVSEQQRSATTYSSTEVVEGTRDPLFLTGVSFPPDYPIGEETRLKLSVYDVREKSQETVTSFLTTMSCLCVPQRTFLGCATFSVDDLVKSKEQQLTLTDFIFSSFFLVFKNPVCKVYRFQTADGQWMFIRELMAECTLSFNIPKQLINLFIQEDMQRIQDLKEMGELSPHWENLRKDMLGQYGQVISCYHDILTELNKITGPNFKPSCSKGEKYLEFIPINLHTQRMRVQCPRTKGKTCHSPHLSSPLYNKIDPHPVVLFQPGSPAYLGVQIFTLHHLCSC
uniref:phosphatidylinositol-3,4-bisphosphate 4-phosphatase n=1 Tax=Erpetoichthys calabaricus TaxID=27687 RepID=A0A8C4RK03_ERPCA